MKDYTSNEPLFSTIIRIVEVTDPAHADNVNMAPKQLLQNTQVLYEYLETICNTEVIEEVFMTEFTYLPGEEVDETAMVDAEIEETLAAEWSGESSEDETAMTAIDVEEAIS